MQTMITQGDFHRVAIVGFQEVPQRLITDMQPNRTGGPKGVTASVLSDYSLFAFAQKGEKMGRNGARPSLGKQNDRGALGWAICLTSLAYRPELLSSDS